ncbi:MAG TPA: hypothetical protein EYN69_10255 [Flavobacteriales bacterium]|nr:hypothetical protein [Flavobacteriales bacterium]
MIDLNKLSVIIPNGNELHFACILGDANQIRELLITNPGFMDALDDDGCSPLGYLVNKELFWFIENKGQKPSTVNMECDDPFKIAASIQYMVKANAQCIYLNKVIPAKDVLKYLVFVSSTKEKYLEVYHYFVVAKMESIARNVEGGIESIVQEHGGLLNDSIYCSIAMGPYLDELISAFENSGMKNKVDFITGVFCNLEGVEGHGPPDPSTQLGAPYDLNVDWLVAKLSKRGLDVAYRE